MIRFPSRRAHSCSRVYFRSSGRSMVPPVVWLNLKSDACPRWFFASTRPKGCGDPSDLYLFPTNLDTEIVGEAATGDVPHADPLLQARGKGSTGHLADWAACREDGVVAAGNSAFQEFEGDQFSRNSFFFLTPQNFHSQKVSLVQSNHPGETGFQRGGGVIQIISIEGILHL